MTSGQSGLCPDVWIFKEKGVLLWKQDPRGFHASGKHRHFAIQGEKTMKKVKITVLKCAWHQDLADKYASPGLGPCTYNREGMTFIAVNGWKKPEGLCDNAWKSMMEYVFALAHGAENFYDGELKDRKAFVASCNDGFRPVSYLIEAMDEDSDGVFAE